MSMQMNESESQLCGNSGIVDDKTNSLKVVPRRPRFHQFSATILQTPIHFTVLKLKDSFMVWIAPTPSFPNLAVGMTLDNANGTPTTVGSSIFGDIADSTSQDLAMRLARKTRCQVFVSCVVSQSEPLLISLVEKRLNEEIDRLQEAFV